MTENRTGGSVSWLRAGAAPPAPMPQATARRTQAVLVAQA
jgi:hypothetical protein